MERQRLKLSLNRRTNPRMAGEKGDGRPMVGNFSNGISGCSFRASASTSFSETKSSTSCPRSRNTSATASPGKRCPPVPPHAITAFMTDPRCDFDAQRHLFLRCGLEHALAVNVQEKPDPEKRHDQIGAAVA